MSIWYEFLEDKEQDTASGCTKDNIRLVHHHDHGGRGVFKVKTAFGATTADPFE